MLVPYLYPCAQKLYQAAVSAEKDGYYLRIYDAFRPNEATRYLYDTFEVLLDEPVPEEETGAVDGSGQRAEKPVDEQAEKFKELLGELDPATVEALKKLSKEALTAVYILPEEYLRKIRLLMQGAAEIPALEDTAMASEDTGLLQSQTPEDAPQSLTLEEIALLQSLSAENAALLQSLTPEDVALLESLLAEDIPVLKELTAEELAAFQEYLVNVVTYRKVVTDYRFTPNSFLSRTISTHNRGIALDLTLHSMDTGEDVEMQTAMHDLSWNSILEKNNENADLLASYMKGVGYKGLYSEWWHFQDDETRYALNLGYLEKGVSPEGWKKDDQGWKYRQADGTYCLDCTVMIEEKERTFNAEGYLMEQ